MESKVFFERNSEKKSQRDAFLRGYEYAVDPIDKRHSFLLVAEAKLEELVASVSLPVLEVVYEDVLADPTGELGRVLAFLDVDVPDGFVAPRPAVAKLDDSLTAAIYERYRADHEQRGSSGPPRRVGGTPW